ENRFHAKYPASSVAQILAPPPVTRYSEAAASYSMPPVFGVAPRSPRDSKTPIGPAAGCAASTMTEKRAHAFMRGTPLTMLTLPHGRGFHEKAGRCQGFFVPGRRESLGADQREALCAPNRHRPPFPYLGEFFGRE